ncbi:Uncharacterized protein Adt_31387 [Abeliophyllum distichum]|uniref:Transposase, Ptta/En/Spm, plant n=1 Tax=Abeliophyllum distichum TaxID=126358 RepID=A0ABD1RER3_9LAMI
MSRVMSTNMPPLPQTQSNSTSTNRFVAPLSLRRSLKANRVVPSSSHTSQSPNTSIPPTRKIGTQSTTETIVTCTAPLSETIRTHTHPEAPLRTLPNQGTQNGLPGDNLDLPPSRHPGCEQDSVIGAGRLPRTPDDVPTRGACKQIKTSRIVRTTQEKIRVLYNSVSRRATSSRVHSLLVHDIGAIIRSHCPMNTCYWRTISSSEKKDLMDEITTNFEIDSKDSRLTSYVNRLYNGRYREFKAELSAYYKLQKTHEVALANPPLEMLDRGVDQWVELCNHFNSDKFKKASSANIENRSKKKYNHRTGSRPLSYIVEEMAVEGSKFLEVDTFEFAYAGKNKIWTDSAAKAQHDEMLAKADEYLTERANEQQLPEDTPLEEIHVDDPDAGLKIMMSVLGVKPGRQIRGLGDGRLRDIDTSSNVRHMEKELEEERAARKAADAARTEIEQRMKSRLNIVGKQFNSTLESWYHSMQQLCRQVPGFILPPFTPLSVEDDAIGDKDNGFDKENNFGEDE